MSNNKSARRSRMRKKKQIEDLTEEACRLKNENDRLKKNIKATEDAYAEMEDTNSVVRVQTMKLSDRLLFLNLMVENAEVLMPLPSDLQNVSASSFLIASRICCSTTYTFSSSPRGVDLRHLKLTRRSP
ncbi:hypothetical protein RYX36_029040 [Vicia faba]